MITLIYIRSKYLYLHQCLFFWSYMFIPGIIFLLSISLFKIGKKEPLPLQPKIEPMISGEDYFFSEEINNTKVKRNYTILKSYLKNMTVVINDQRCCKIYFFIIYFIRPKSYQSLDTFSNPHIFALQR